MYVFIKRVAKLTAVIIKGYHCYQLHTKFYTVFLYVDDIIWDHQCGF